MSENDAHPDRAFVLGIDGVPWDLLERWISAEELPNLGRLAREGVAGPLASTSPPTTPLAWPSIATGVSPGKHGIYGFQKLSPSYTNRMYRSDDVRQPALWELLSPALVGNVPMTYPAQPIDGKMFTGMMTPSINDSFAHPEALGEELLDRVPDYEIGLDWSEYEGTEDEFVEDISTLVEQRREAMEVLMETGDWRLFFFVFTAPDRLQHHRWDEDVLLSHYRHLDDVVGDVVDYVERFGATLYVVSDHGFGPISRLVRVNRVLEEAGYLARADDDGVRGVFSKLDLSRDRVNELLSRVGIDDHLLLDRVPDVLLRSVATQLPGEHVLFDVDYEETAAFSYGSGAVYINEAERFEDGWVPPEQVDAVKAEVAETLSSVTDPETGIAPLEVHDGDELYPDDDRSPDLIVETADGYEQLKSVDGETFSDTSGTVGSHRSEGVFLAWGPEVAAGGIPRAASVVDVAPTLLHALGEPVPANADGRVLTEIFAPHSTPAVRTPETHVYDERAAGTAGDDDYEEVEDRLRGLGYLE